jgi:two-component system, oxyanion-binding sensor
VKHTLDIGFVALTDAAPLIVAHAKGLFRDEGLDVGLHREVSWATIRDKVAAGVYHGAHMLAPMAVAVSGGIGSEKAALVVPQSLNSNSAVLGVSAQLAESMATSDPANPRGRRAFAEAIERRRGPRGPVASFAVVYPFSLHNYFLRNWAVAAGLDPDSDMRIVIAPPTGIAARLRAGEIDGFCVGGPWGLLCEAEARAQIILTAREFWPGAPEKVLGLSAAWADAEPDAARALSRAVLRAGVWADAPENRKELTELLALPEHVAAPAETISRGLELNGVSFVRGAAAFPWKSHALWILSQMRRWGQMTPDADVSAALACYRPDMFRAAAADIGLNAPVADVKVEGAHEAAWEIEGSLGSIAMPADARFDGSVFDPKDFSPGGR